MKRSEHKPTFGQVWRAVNNSYSAFRNHLKNMPKVQPAPSSLHHLASGGGTHRSASEPLTRPGPARAVWRQTRFLGLGGAANIAHASGILEVKGHGHVAAPPPPQRDTSQIWEAVLGRRPGIFNLESDGKIMFDGSAKLPKPQSNPHSDLGPDASERILVWQNLSMKALCRIHLGFLDDAERS